MPTLHREAGLRYFFRSSDRPEPPHVHVVGGGGKAKVWLMPVRLENARGYSRRRVDRIVEVTEAHLEEWFAIWRGFFREA